MFFAGSSAAELGVIEAFDDRPRAGRDPTITPETKRHGTVTLMAGIDLDNGP
jgi:hypothetical protein